MQQPTEEKKKERRKQFNNNCYLILNSAEHRADTLTEQNPKTISSLIVACIITFNYNDGLALLKYIPGPRNVRWAIGERI